MGKVVAGLLDEGSMGLATDLILVSPGLGITAFAMGSSIRLYHVAAFRSAVDYDHPIQFII
jgi:hypothetical protein